jgi:hypothetical protein
MLTKQKWRYVLFSWVAKKNMVTIERYLPDMETSDIQTILRLFEGSPFPRTVSTYATGGRQVAVTNSDEMFTLFEQANFVDCRINAYPVPVSGSTSMISVQQSPDIVRPRPFKVQD